MVSNHVNEISVRFFGDTAVAREAKPGSSTPGIRNGEDMSGPIRGYGEKTNGRLWLQRICSHRRAARTSARILTSHGSLLPEGADGKEIAAGRVRRDPFARRGEPPAQKRCFTRKPGGRRGGPGLAAGDHRWRRQLWGVASGACARGKRRRMRRKVGVARAVWI
jgi:hypothetical protein